MDFYLGRFFILIYMGGLAIIGYLFTVVVIGVTVKDKFSVIPLVWVVLQVPVYKYVLKPLLSPMITDQNWYGAVLIIAGIISMLIVCKITDMFRALEWRHYVAQHREYMKRYNKRPH